jgi:hypothetical protein
MVFLLFCGGTNYFIDFAAILEVDQVWLDLVLDFEPPNRFVPERYIAGLAEVPNEVWEAVPRIVAQTICQVIGPDVPIDPQIAFRYFKNGRIPEFVLCYFMWFQKARSNTSKATRFFRAVHYLEAFREYMLNAAGAGVMDVDPKPEDEELEADPAVAEHGPAVEGGERDEDQEEEAETGVGSEEQAEAEAALEQDEEAEPEAQI